MLHFNKRQNGQRVKKIANGKTIYFIYDQSGNLIEEADENGEVMADYIYLGSIPVARVDEWWEGMPIPQAPTGLTVTHGNEQLTVSWNANQEPVDGYKVYWGTESGNYTNSVDVGKTTSYTITELTNGVSYYIAVKAYVDLKETYYYHTDHLGTPIMMTDKNQNVVWNGEFLPFGESFAITGTVKNNLRFPGQYYDAETGLHYNWYRDYKPVIGRYLEEDPIGLKGGISRYVYAQNSPVRFRDPLGLLSCDGEWKQVGWDRLYNIVCVCYWLCIPCDGQAIWSGNKRGQPSTIGTVINASGDIESGDNCICKKPGSEKDCEKCE